MAETVLRKKYADVKLHASGDAKSLDTGTVILDLAVTSLQFLTERCEPVDLVSRVANKAYFTYKKKKVVARPANAALFIANHREVGRLWKKWLAEKITPSEFARMTYTVALAPCLAMELFDRQNKKGPATYFECYIGHLFAKAVDVNPTKRARLPVKGRDVLMTMDFLIDVGDSHPRVHLPVKMSTRERVVQAWAHQRLLDAAFGKGAYRGVMVLFSETKLDSRSLEVVEICVPEQWLAYQVLLAEMDRIYYFDLPVRYRELTDEYPDVISIKEFGKFFREKEAVLHS